MNAVLGLNGVTCSHDTDTDTWKIILGVCLGVPLAVIIAINVFCLVRYKRRQLEKKQIRDDSR